MLVGVALATLNHLLQEASWARARLAPFAGKSARISLPPLRLDLAVTADGMFASTETTAFEVEVALPADAPLLALRGKRYEAKSISGSAEFADALGFVLSNLRWDFEEDLSKAIGDIAAHRVAGLLSAFGDWQGQATRNLVENIAEYLTEEQPTLVKSSVIAGFAESLVEVRDELARLEQRIAKLGG